MKAEIIQEFRRWRSDLKARRDELANHIDYNNQKSLIGQEVCMIMILITGIEARIDYLMEEK